MSKQNDRALRIYNEVLELDRLHYGLWQPDDELTIDNLKIAQERYESLLIDSIPQGVKSVLDVGCGTGIMSKRLIAEGYDVEGLSPDNNQQKLFTESLEVPFHHCIFEDFQPQKKYDCLIMSESAQYINLEKFFPAVSNALKANGHLIVCDYFVKNDASGILAKSGHNLENFLTRAKSAGFTIVQEKDITADVTKTLDIAKNFADKLFLAADIGTEKFRAKHPHLLRFLQWYFRKKIEKSKEQLALIDSVAFAENKSYNFFVFQSGA